MNLIISQMTNSIFIGLIASIIFTFISNFVYSLTCDRILRNEAEKLQNEFVLFESNVQFEYYERSIHNAEHIINSINIIRSNLRIFNYLNYKDLYLFMILRIPLLRMKIIYTLLENIDIFISAMIYKTYGYDKNNEDLERNKYILEKLYLYNIDQPCIKYSIDMLEEILNNNSIIKSFNYSFGSVTEEQYISHLPEILIPDKNALKINYKNKRFCLSNVEYNNLIKYFQIKLREIVSDYEEHQFDFLKK